jgi:hypothetical protein
VIASTLSRCFKVRNSEGGIDEVYQARNIDNITEPEMAEIIQEDLPVNAEIRRVNAKIIQHLQQYLRHVQLRMPEFSIHSSVSPFLRIDVTFDAADDSDDKPLVIFSEVECSHDMIYSPAGRKTDVCARFAGLTHEAIQRAW